MNKKLDTYNVGQQVNGIFHMQVIEATPEWLKNLLFCPIHVHVYFSAVVIFTHFVQKMALSEITTPVSVQYKS